MLWGKACWFIINRNEGKRHYFLMKNFNSFMYNHTLHRWIKDFVVIVYKLLVQQKY